MADLRIAAHRAAGRAEHDGEAPLASWIAPGATGAERRSACPSIADRIAFEPQAHPVRLATPMRYPVFPSAASDRTSPGVGAVSIYRDRGPRFRDRAEGRAEFRRPGEGPLGRCSPATTGRSEDRLPRGSRGREPASGHGDIEAKPEGSPRSASSGSPAAERRRAWRMQRPRSGPRRRTTRAGMAAPARPTASSDPAPRRCPRTRSAPGGRRPRPRYRPGRWRSRPRGGRKAPKRARRRPGSPCARRPGSRSPRPGRDRDQAHVARSSGSRFPGDAASRGRGEPGPPTSGRRRGCRAC